MITGKDHQGKGNTLLWEHLVYFSIGCGTSKFYICLEDNKSSFSRVSLNPKLRMCVHKQPFSSVCKRYDFQKTKIWRKTSLCKNVCLVLNSRRSTNLLNVFGNWLWVPPNAILEVSPLRPWIFKYYNDDSQDIHCKDKFMQYLFVK